TPPPGPNTLKRSVRIKSKVAVTGARPMNSLVEVLQQYGPLFGILAAVVTVLGVAFTISKSAHDRLVTDLRDQVREKDRRIETLEKEGLRLVNEQFTNQRRRYGRPHPTLRRRRPAAKGRGGMGLRMLLALADPQAPGGEQALRHAAAQPSSS